MARSTRPLKPVPLHVRVSETALSLFIVLIVLGPSFTDDASPEL